MRLNALAQHDPETGQWHRVCQGCFQGRQGYLSDKGRVRDRTPEFKRWRQTKMERLGLEASLRMKRLGQLKEHYQRREMKAKRGSWWFMGLGGVEEEVRVCGWQPDETMTHCPGCWKPFHTLLLRRHHCRLCGCVLCDGCSQWVPLTVDEPVKDDDVVRSCPECFRWVIERPRYQALNRGITEGNAMVQLYEQIQSCKSELDRRLPEFNQLLMEIKTSTAETQESTKKMMELKFKQATTLRQALVALFHQMEVTAQRMVEQSQSKSGTEHMCARSVGRMVNGYLQNHMFTLQLLPKRLPYQNNADQKKHENTAVVNNDGFLNVLVEQRLQLQHTLNEAVKQRRFDDVQTLQQHLRDLDAEIQRHQ